MSGTSQSVEIDLLADSVSGELDTTPYGTLERVDRYAAENLNRFFRANTHIGRGKTTLADRAVLQAVATSLPLAVADFLALYTSVYLTTAVFERVLQISTYQVENHTAFFISLAILPIAHLAGLYPGVGDNPIVEFRQIARTLFAALAVLAGVGWFCFPEHSGFYICAALAAFCIALPWTVLLRFGARKLASQWCWWGVPTFIVAEPDHAKDMFERLVASPEQGFRPFGVLLDEGDSDAADRLMSAGVPVYSLKRAKEDAIEHGVTFAIVSNCAAHRLSAEVDEALSVIPNRVLLSSEQIDVGIWDHLYNVGSRSGLRLAGAQPNSIELFAKRVLDILVSGLVLLLGSPIWLAICAIIKVTSPGPIFYSQGRIGLGGEHFKAWKFRSMAVNAEELLESYLTENPAAREEWDKSHKLKNDPRVTWVGKFLRSTSLDELPQLWNIVRGQMSLVGPRPIVDSPTYDADYVRKYVAEFEAYKSVPPGLTGLWQVRCRNRGVYEMRIYYDMYYIRNWNIWLDLYLIMRTVRTVLFREGT